MPAEAEREPSESAITRPPVRREKNEKWAVRGLLSASEITRGLLRFRYDPAFRGARRVPIRTLAALVGLSHETLYQAMRPGIISERTHVRLSWAIVAISEGRLCLRRRGQAWQVDDDDALCSKQVTPDSL
jgi:hypothetical protein